MISVVSLWRNRSKYEAEEKVWNILMVASMRVEAVKDKEKWMTAFNGYLECRNNSFSWGLVVC